VNTPGKSTALSDLEISDLETEPSLIYPGNVGGSIVYLDLQIVKCGSLVRQQENVTRVSEHFRSVEGSENRTRGSDNGKLKTNQVHT
jgi:hypothetical protein